MDAKLTKAEEAGKVAVSSRMPVEKLVQIQVLVDRGNTDQQIMDISGLPLSDIQEIITVEGWRNNVLLTPEQAVVALENRNVLLKRWERAIGAQARFLSFHGLQMAAGAKTPRDFKDAAQGTKLMVDIAREAEGMDGKEKKSLAGSGSVISMFYIEAPLEPRRKVEENVTPVEATPVKNENEQVEF
jgi:hypothetical protein